MPITAQDVSVAGDKGGPILQGIRLTIPDAAVTLIVGRNGAGKTTLLDALSGLITLQAGTIRYDEQPLWQDGRLNPHVLRRIGNVFQYPEQQLFAQTVEREFAFSLRHLKLAKQEEAERMQEALRLMRLPQQLREATPHLLSGGQKRRVALATTMAARPQWLMLDEPTAGLDADGTAALLEFLREQKAAGRSIVVATHDLDALLPVADRVIVLRDGLLAADLAQSQLAAAGGALREAGLGTPAALRMADMLRQAGVPLPGHYPRPRELADALAQADQARRKPAGVERAQDAAAAHASVDDGGAHGLSAAASSGESPSARTHNAAEPPLAHKPPPHERPARAAGGPDLVARIDPRAKWLFYMFISIGILLQKSWLGLLAGAAATVALALYARLNWQPFVKVLSPFLFFVIISFMISGVELDDGVYFALESAMITLFELSKILVVMALGVMLAATTSQLLMKRAIEQSLSGLRRLRLPVDALALGASLMLRFIPVMGKEYRRFARIVKARGKNTSKKGGIRWRQFPSLFIPLIISLFQLASDLTTAMQARGLTSFKQPRTSSFKLSMRCSDWLTVIAGALVFLCFFVIHLIN